MLKEHGCELMRERGKHEVWRNNMTGKSFAVPRKLKGEGTLQAILKKAGIETRQ